MFFRRIKKTVNREFWKIVDFWANPILFGHQSTMLVLSVVMVIAACIVIKGSTIPMISNNRIFYTLFYSDSNGDKTLYNIAVSIIAAYIFYIFQVYIPEVKKFNRDNERYSQIYKYEIFLLNQYITAWDVFLKKERGKCIFTKFDYSCGSNITGSINKNTYAETIDALQDNLKQIIDDHYFSMCDARYQKFINESSIRIHWHLEYMYDKFPIWSDEIYTVKDYKVLKKVVLDDMERIMKTFCYLDEYHVYKATIKPYSEIAKWAKLAEKL